MRLPVWPNRSICCTLSRFLSVDRLVQYSVRLLSPLLARSLPLNSCWLLCWLSTSQKSSEHCWHTAQISKDDNRLQPILFQPTLRNIFIAYSKNPYGPDNWRTIWHRVGTHLVYLKIGPKIVSLVRKGMRRRGQEESQGVVGAPKKAAKASGRNGSCQILPQTNFATANFIHTKNPWRDNFFHFPDKSEMFLQSILCA